MITNPDLSILSTEDLAKEILLRGDLFEGATLKPALYKLLTEMSAIMCVDGIAVRKRDDHVEALAIKRNTGEFRGKLCSVGGRILLEESIEQALRRQFTSDLGCKITFITPWDKPAIMHQFMRPRADGTTLPDFGAEHERRHAVNAIYLISVDSEDFIFGTTPHGGQEAFGVEWFSLLNMPADDAFGYGQEVYFKKCLELAETLL
jgi:ADP-ribose pyrophosphatase YjhB (NUDIX family)